MAQKTPNPNPQDQPHHEGGDPASLKEDPAQAYPTGGAGLIKAAEQGRGDLGKAPPRPDEDRPTK